MEHTLQRKRQKPVEYRNNSLDLEILYKCYVQAMKKESNEDIAKRIITHLLNVGTKIRPSRIPVPLPSLKQNMFL